MNSISKEIFAGIVYSTEALIVWEDLRERFDKVHGSRIFTLHRDIGRLVQGNSTISVYFSKLRQLWDEYSSMVTLPSCKCESAMKFVEYEQQHKLLQFLMGLNESYALIRSHVLMMTPLPTVSHAFAIISQEESHRNLSSVSPDLPTSVFYSAQDKRKSNVCCEHCNWPGHNKENCYRLIGYPPGL
ncbi:uncharacterized protein [Henckelia pumila]|uniref:uncharacterized protein n=1 Tax=Henckelia pumila TaxID=405737 RepID=UPI003C6E60AB